MTTLFVTLLAADLVLTLVAFGYYRRKWKQAQLAADLAGVLRSIETKRADMWKGVVEEAIGRQRSGEREAPN